MRPAEPTVPAAPARRRGLHAALAGAVWLAGWAVVVLGDARMDLVNQAMVLVATSALAALWLPVGAVVVLSLATVLLFNWGFVAPRGTLRVEAPQNLGLLLAMLAVNTEVAVLLAAQRRQAGFAQRHAREADELRRWGDRLREVPEPLDVLPELADLLARAMDRPVALMAWRERPGPAVEAGRAMVLGEPADDEVRAALQHALVEGRPMGPGTGYHDGLGFWVLPMRCTGPAQGAAALCGPAVGGQAQALRRHLQALCDLWGAARQRARAALDEQAAQLRAQEQGVRNALLASVSHDYRTPLATILGAASSLEAQGERMAPAQRTRLARTIAEEALQLSRLTDNALQLARLEAPGLQLRMDWESAEEVVGAALHRARRRGVGEPRVGGRVEPELPLLWCDALLLAQLLDNLVDNALRYSPAEAPIEILARLQEGWLVLAVRDRGPGVPAPWRDKVFEPFQRGPEPGPRADGGRAGAGVGLAVCRAIARAHGGELRLRRRAHGGSAFDCRLPVRAQPELRGPEEEEGRA